MGITATDFFCGAGGSSEGMKNAGVEVKMAVNHWQLAIDTHNTNHPDTDHDCVDIRTVHPSHYPSTDIFWASPECTNHSLAKGKARKNVNQADLWGNTKVDPTEERSRATMREVVEFAAYHHNPIVVVENVVDIRYWQHYEDWLRDMMNLGYEYRTLYLNAMFFGVPQSRDRWYTVFWKKGNKAPNLDFRPAAFCPKCEMAIEAVQSFKKDFQWGRYGTNRQYVYRCPRCGGEVKPPTTPAASVIDWSLPAQRIGDRKQPLKPKTVERILAGLKKFSSEAVLVNIAYTHAEHDGQVRSLEAPMPTQTARQTMAMAIPPFIATYHHKWHAVATLDDPMRCLTTFNNENYLVIPPFQVILKYSNPNGPSLPPRSLDEPLSTLVASASQHWITIPPFIASLNHSDIRNAPVDETFPTVMPAAHPSLIIPPFLSSVNYFDDRNISLDEPMATQTTANKYGLVAPPFIVPLRKEVAPHSVSEPLFTVTAGNHHALVDPAELLDDCRFRMLEPHELKLAMSFPDSYVILGSKKDQVRQVGNAVAVAVAEWIIKQCVASLAA